MVQVLRYILYTHVVCAGVWSRKRVCMCCLCWGMVEEASVHVLSVLGYGLESVHVLSVLGYGQGS